MTMTDINNKGTLGLVGIDGFDPLFAGTAGGDGGASLPGINFGDGIVLLNTEEATGGVAARMSPMCVSRSVELLEYES